MPNAPQRLVASAVTLLKRRRWLIKIKSPGDEAKLKSVGMEGEECQTPASSSTCSAKSARPRMELPASPLSTCSTRISQTSETSQDLLSLRDDDEDCWNLEVPSFWEHGDAHERWSRALAGRPVVEMPEEELRALICSGAPIPLKYRMELWPHYFASDIEHPDSLDQLIASVPEDVVRLIDLDVPRTLPQWLDHSQRVVLRRVLLGLAAMSPDTGYCQGLNNIAAVFVVLGFHDTTAVACVQGLLRRCCPCYHAPGLPGFRREAALLMDLAQQLLPKEAQTRLSELDVPLEALAAQHFLSLASCNDWPLAATAQLWDMLLLDDRSALVASFLALLRLHLPSEEEALDADLEAVELFHRNVKRAMTEDPGSLLEELQSILPSVKEVLKC